MFPYSLSIKITVESSARTLFIKFIRHRRRLHRVVCSPRNLGNQRTKSVAAEQSLKIIRSMRERASASISMLEPKQHICIVMQRFPDANALARHFSIKSYSRRRRTFFLRARGSHIKCVCVCVISTSNTEHTGNGSKARARCVLGS